jgi:hypothetical protein
LGVNPKAIHTWINTYSKPKTAVARTDEHIYDENKRLKKALARMTSYSESKCIVYNSM